MFYSIAKMVVAELEKISNEKNYSAECRVEARMVAQALKRFLRYF